MLALIFLAPLPIWALGAHVTRRSRVLGVVLTALVAIELAVGWHLIFLAVRITLLVCLPLATAVVVLLGLAGGRADPERRLRRNAWHLLSAFYSAVAIVGALVTLVVVLDDYPTRPPSVSEIQPLTSGLYIAGNISSCSTGSGDFCDRDLIIASTARASNATVLAELRTSLTARGWPLAPDGRGGWTAGRSEGILPDAHNEYVSLSILNGHVAVNLEEGAGEP